MPYVIAAIVGVAVIVAVVVVMRRRAAFVIAIHESKPTLLRGEARGDYLTDVERLCQLWSVREGRIIGVSGPKGMKIEVDGGIPQEHRRAFQNAWDHPL